MTRVGVGVFMTTSFSELKVPVRGDSGREAERKFPSRGEIMAVVEAAGEGYDW